MQSTDIIITNILTTGTAFAVVASDMTQNVFIPSRLLEHDKLRSGETVGAYLVPNVTRPDKTQWLAIGFARGAAPSDTLAGQILADLQQGRATLQEIAESIGADLDEVREQVQRLLEQGRLIHEETYDLAAEVSA